MTPTNIGYSGNRTEGKHYQHTKDLGVVEIAKLIRQDLKYPQFKRCKFSVTTNRYAGGASINIKILAGTKPIRPNSWIRANIRYETTGASKDFEKLLNTEKLTKYGKTLLQSVKDIWWSYNSSDSDSQSDYDNCGFYGYVKYDLNS